MARDLARRGLLQGPRTQSNLISFLARNLMVTAVLFDYSPTTLLAMLPAAGAPGQMVTAPHLVFRLPPRTATTKCCSSAKQTCLLCQTKERCGGHQKDNPTGHTNSSTICHSIITSQNTDKQLPLSWGSVCFLGMLTDKAACDIPSLFFH